MRPRSRRTPPPSAEPTVLQRRDEAATHEGDPASPAGKRTRLQPTRRWVTRGRRRGRAGASRMRARRGAPPGTTFRNTRSCTQLQQARSRAITLTEHRRPTKTKQRGVRKAPSIETDNETREGIFSTEPRSDWLMWPGTPSRYMHFSQLGLPCSSSSHSIPGTFRLLLRAPFGKVAVSEQHP